MKRIIIGTRPSQLAVAQTQIFADQLKALQPDLEIEIKKITTSGDNKQGLSGNIERDKKDWISELEKAILKEEIHLALHSAKDVPYDIESGLEVISVLKRANPQDILISKKIAWGDLANKHSTKIGENFKLTLGTASLRRKAQILNKNSDIEVVELRGNITTRISRLNEREDLDGIILAAAGLERLQVDHSFQTDLIDCSLMTPCATQGILAAQFSSANSEIKSLLTQLSDSHTNAAFLAERAVVAELKANCHSALAAYATITNNELSLIAKVYSQNGEQEISYQLTGASVDAEDIGKKVAIELLKLGAGQLL